MRYRKLDHTRNLIELFVYAMGKTDVPLEYRQWSILSTICATVGNRIVMHVMRNDPLAPNLYTVLVGPSGTGKGVAMRGALRFVRDLPALNLYMGKTTAEALKQQFAPSKANPSPPNNVFLVHEELADGVGEGEIARSLVRLLTGHSESGDKGWTYKYGTVTRGQYTFKPPCINWLAGTTIEWLRRTFNQDDLAGGFFARVVASSPAALPNPKAFPEYPQDVHEVEAELHARLEALSLWEGHAELDDEARHCHERWVETRPVTSDKLLLPIRNRSKSIVLKLAMGLALADFDTSADRLVVTMPYLVAAQRLAEESEKVSYRVIVKSYETAETAGSAVVAEYVERCGTVTKRQLTKFALTRGINATRLREITTTLKDAGQIDEIASPVNPLFRVYTWAAKRKPVRN